MSYSMNFARIFPPVCSCGNYVGKLQYQIEIKLAEKQIEQNIKTNDEDIVKILDDLKITRICCRNSILISPIQRIVSTKNHMNVYLDNKIISERLNRIEVKNEDPDF